MLYLSSNKCQDSFNSIFIFIQKPATQPMEIQIIIGAVIAVTNTQAQGTGTKTTYEYNTFFNFFPPIMADKN